MKSDENSMWYNHCTHQEFKKKKLVSLVGIFNTYVRVYSFEQIIHRGWCV